MDKNTFTGLLLIAAIVIGFSILNSPSEEEIEAQRRRQDSIEQVESEKLRRLQEMEESAEEAPSDSDTETSQTTEISDSAKQLANYSLYGSFANSAEKSDNTIEVETDLMKLYFSAKGGKIKKVILKDYSTYEGGELVLMDSTSKFNLEFFTRENKEIFTDELVFSTEEESFKVTGESEKILSFKLDAGNDRYIEYLYKIKGNDYLIDFDVNMVNMEKLMDMRSGEEIGRAHV